MRRNRYKIAIFALMTPTPGVCIVLAAARIAVSDSGRCASLVGNLGARPIYSRLFASPPQSYYNISGQAPGGVR